MTIKMAKIQNTDTTKCWRVYAARGILILCCWDCKMILQLWKTVWRFLTKLYTLQNLTYTPAIMLLGIFPKELKTYVRTKNCTQVIIAASFITAITGSNRAGEWINKLGYSQR